MGAVTRLKLVTRNGAPAGPGSDIAIDTDFLDRYDLGEIIGRGAMAMVMEATERSSGDKVAVKFLLRPGADAGKRLLQEGRLMLEIRHPCVLRVFEFGEMSGHPYLVCELLPGGNLRDVLTRSGSLPIPDAVAMMADILAGLHACHEHGVVHRDLKPENVLIDAAGRPKLADLGIAKAFGSTQDLTKVGMLLGTPTYMSPEQVRAEVVTVGADIYAAGAMMYELVAGRPPFVSDQLPDLLTKHLCTEPQPLAELVPGVPEALAQAVHMALAKRIDERPRSADDFARRLRKSVAAARPTPVLGGGSGSSIARPGFAPPIAGGSSSNVPRPRLNTGDQAPNAAPPARPQTETAVAPANSGDPAKPARTTGGGNADARPEDTPSRPAESPRSPTDRSGSGVVRPSLDRSGSGLGRRPPAKRGPPAKPASQQLLETVGIGVGAVVIAIVAVLLMARSPGDERRRPPPPVVETR